MKRYITLPKTHLHHGTVMPKTDDKRLSFFPARLKDMPVLSLPNVCFKYKSYVKRHTP